MAESIPEFVVTAHARSAMKRRGIDSDLVRRVMQVPDQRLPVRRGRDVLQARVEISGSRYLVRVVVDVSKAPAEVVTVYRTSKIQKYWSGS